MGISIDLWIGPVRRRWLGQTWKAIDGLQKIIKKHVWKSMENSSTWIVSKEVSLVWLYCR